MWPHVIHTRTWTDVLYEQCDVRPSFAELFLEFQPHRQHAANTASAHMQGTMVQARDVAYMIHQTLKTAKYLQRTSSVLHLKRALTQIGAVPTWRRIVGLTFIRDGAGSNVIARSRVSTMVEHGDALYPRIPRALPSRYSIETQR